MTTARIRAWPVRPSWPLVVFLVSAAVMLSGVLSGVELRSVHPLRAFGFFDLKIYRQSALVVLSGRPLYAAKFQLGDGFTYPPIAALMFLVLPVFPLRLDELGVELINIALVAVIARHTLRLRRTPADGAPLPRPAAAWLCAALALWIEPVTSAIAFGQIDVLIAALVIVDLTRGGSSRWGGLGIGAAAALKLTPLVFIPYLAFAGRGRMAARALVAFLLSIVAASVILPRDALAYWGGAFLDTSRVTGHRPFAGRGPANQSLRGALLRIAPSAPDRTEIWLLACVLVAGTGLLLAVRAARRGNQALGFVLTAITGLLICPVSWTHHWTIAVPGVLLLLTSTRRSVSRSALVAVTAVLALGCQAIWVVIHAHPEGSNLGVGDLLLGDLYVAAGLGTIAIAGLIELRAPAARMVRVASNRARRRARGMPARGPAAARAQLRVTPPGEPAVADRQLS